MPYPDSPFTPKLNTQFITEINKRHQVQVAETTPVKVQIQNGRLDSILRWICTWPQITTLRVNTLKSNNEDIIQLVKQKLHKIFQNEILPKVELHPLIPEVVIIHHKMAKCLERTNNEIIVDVDCATALLRGAHVYAPGVIGMMSGIRMYDKVSIYADLSRKCKKGLQKFYDDQNKLFIGNGIAKMIRHELFGENLNPCGVAIEVTETISGCPPIGDDFIPNGTALLQNLPSIICVHILDPQPNETVLDMCASPGNKTTHIAALMGNKGTLVAIDKTPSKVKTLQRKCEEFAVNVHVFEADSTKISNHNSGNHLRDGPPFPPEAFDRILLDAPCSVLGKRPQLLNPITSNVLKSYVPLQRKLFETAVNLAKVNGTIVYSTCTITLSENEGMVAWALKTFPCLNLIRSKFHFGGEGWEGSDLTEEQRRNVQRFGPDQMIDSVGFFIACFIKISSI